MVILGTEETRKGRKLYMATNGSSSRIQSDKQLIDSC